MNPQKRFKVSIFSFWKEKPGVIGPTSCWCCAYDGIPGYLHVQSTFPGLLWELMTEFRNDKHLVGY